YTIWFEDDNQLFKVETLEFWVPPAFYKDGTIDVTIDRISGAYAVAGPIYIYRYEYEEGEGGGPMAQESKLLNDGAITVFPNPFKEKIEIRFSAGAVGQTFRFAKSGVQQLAVAKNVVLLSFQPSG
ncbi:MAG: hypothetical protein N3A65_10250, partial [candidate division WOR-3 bacterium]|nr:hypothetical protein [candidate division WOR-3 bacterium]